MSVDLRAPAVLGLLLCVAIGLVGLPSCATSSTSQHDDADKPSSSEADDDGSEPGTSHREASSRSADLEYPETRQSDASSTLHGVTVRAPYRWLESSGDDAVQNWSERQNETTNRYLETLADREALRRSLVEYDDFQRFDQLEVHGGRIFLKRSRDVADAGTFYKGSFEAVDPELTPVVDRDALVDDREAVLVRISPSPNARRVAIVWTPADEDAYYLEVADVGKGEEYGLATDREDFRAMKKFSPYHQLESGQSHPPTLAYATKTIGDGRPHPMHARKYVAALQNRTSTPGPYLFASMPVLEPNAPDQYARVIYDYRRDRLAFLMKHTGLLNE